MSDPNIGYATQKTNIAFTEVEMFVRYFKENSVDPHDVSDGILATNNGQSAAKVKCKLHSH